MNRIGNDQVFIEFDGNYQNSNFIPLRLCIEGEYLGTLDSPTYVTSFIYSLKNLLNDKCSACSYLQNPYLTFLFFKILNSAAHKKRKTTPGWHKHSSWPPCFK